MGASGKCDEAGGVYPQYGAAGYDDHDHDEENDHNNLDDKENDHDDLDNEEDDYDQVDDNDNDHGFSKYREFNRIERWSRRSESVAHAAAVAEQDDGEP